MPSPAVPQEEKQAAAHGERRVDVAEKRDRVAFSGTTLVRRGFSKSQMFLQVLQINK